MQYLLQMGTHQHSVIWILDGIILHIRDVLKSVLRVDCIPQLYFMEFWDFHEKHNFFWNDEITAGYAALVRRRDTRNETKVAQPEFVDITGLMVNEL